MSLDVALQSVAFYVLSCSTCAKINHRRKAKIQAKRERAEKHELETEQPGLYRHPSPFSTNPYWAEEIRMGPGPPNKKLEKECKNTSQAALNTGPGSSSANSASMSTGAASSPTVVDTSQVSGEAWNRMRYQREDEDLWGHDTQGPGQRIMDAITRAGETAGRLLEGRLSRTVSEEENPRSYYLAKNPPVNDLHPPVVSTQPASRDETRWMLQPPPPAKVMEGKERVNRNRAASNTSSRRGPEESLGRQVAERLVDAKVQRAGTPSHSDVGRTSSQRTSSQRTSSRPTSSRPQSRPKTSNSNRPKGQRHERSTSISSASSGSDETTMKRKRKPPNLSISPTSTSPTTIEHIPIPSSPAATTKEVQEQSDKPILSTDVSSSVSFPQDKKEKGGHLALRELSPLSTNRAANSRTPSPSNRLPPNANSMPVTVPTVQSKFPGADTFIFPNPKTAENTEPAGLGIELDAAKAN
jgi:hypothetical protein